MVKKFLAVGRSEVHAVKPMGLFCLTGAKIRFQAVIEYVMHNT